MNKEFIARVLNRASGRRTQGLLGDPVEYVKAAYLILLRRPADPVGMALWEEQIATGRFSHQAVIDGLLSSAEYQSNFAIPLLDIVHQSRQRWIETLDAFATILDIGGSSANIPEGSLIEMGYAHRPQRLDILDLPEDEQYWGRPKYDQRHSHDFEWGSVHFHHGRAEAIDEVASLQELRFDCVFLGQAIEHIYMQSLPATLAWIRDHLNPGGKLVFDTPNRLVTKVQSPNSFVDPDHKHEYNPDEMAAVLVDSGFRVVRTTGMVHLPQMAASGVYSPQEFVGAPAIHEDVDRCYMFAMEAEAVA